MQKSIAIFTNETLTFPYKIQLNAQRKRRGGEDENSK